MTINKNLKTLAGFITGLIVSFVLIIGLAIVTGILTVQTT